MIRSLHGDSGNKNSTLDEKGLKVADDKRRELAATEPMQLAGSGRFDGLHEVVEMSNGSLQDVSSSLKEALVCWEKCRQFRKIALVQWLLACKSVIRLCTWGYGETINI
eukprot:g19178.t1